MRGVLFFIFLLLLLSGAGAGALFYLHAEPSTAALDADLASVRSEIAAAEKEQSQTAAGLIRTLISLRLSFLKDTEAMLSQKRSSLLRRIDLTYSVDGHALAPASEAVLTKISADLAVAEQKLAKDEVEAERYSGGLVQALALMTVATDRISIAELNLAYYGNKYGIALPIELHPPTGVAPGQSAPGTIVKDKDAL